MSDLGKMLILLGIVIASVGAILRLLAHFGFRGLPGDIRYQGENVRFYFPIVTCIVISVLLTLTMWIWRWLSKR